MDIYSDALKIGREFSSNKTTESQLKLREIPPKNVCYYVQKRKLGNLVEFTEHLSIPLFVLYKHSVLSKKKKNRKSYDMYP